VDIPGLHNPVMPAGNAADVARRLNDLGGLMALPVLACAAAALIMRLRRSRGMERQQLKWFTYSAALAGVVLGVSPLTPDVVFFAGLLILAGLPITAGLAILRYRLYDIDVVINRTLVYGVTVAIVGAGFVAAALFLQTLLRPITAGSDVAIAASTLATVAAFQPLRRWVQAAIDQRFYRHRYDAARTLDAFAARLRDEVDLDAVRGDLLVAIDSTVRPTHAAVWLREAGR
jgi:hypothetical protein